MNIENMQLVFDKATKGIIGQGKKSKNATTGECMYRCGNLRCAIGFLITDANYSDTLETKAFYEKEVVKAVEDSLGTSSFTDSEIAFLDRLQLIHDNTSDNSTFIYEFKKRATQLANEFNLKCNF